MLEERVGQTQNRGGKSSNKLQRLKKAGSEAQPAEDRIEPPIYDTENPNVLPFLNQIKMYVEDPEKLKALKDSLRNYILLKESRFLNRERKHLSFDEKYICECVSSQEAHAVTRYVCLVSPQKKPARREKRSQHRLRSQVSQHDHKHRV